MQVRNNILSIPIDQKYLSDESVYLFYVLLVIQRFRHLSFNDMLMSGIFNRSIHQ